MRNTIPQRLLSVSFFITLGHLLTGCAANTSSPELSNASAALSGGNYAEAISQTDTYLARNPTGDRLADAYYLKGRALEDAPAATQHDARINLQAARSAYIQGLKAVPSPQLDGLIRSSLADVAYWQEDYVTASEQGLAAYNNMEDPSDRAWTLYRAGVSQQRMGKFLEADQTLQQVIVRHPNSEPAKRAAGKVGARNFNVQVATFGNPQLADKAVSDLTRMGIPSNKQAIDSTRTIVRAGPYISYQQAQQVRSQVANIYHDAVVVP